MLVSTKASYRLRLELPLGTTGGDRARGLGAESGGSFDWRGRLATSDSVAGVADDCIQTIRSPALRAHRRWLEPFKWLRTDGEAVGSREEPRHTRWEQVPAPPPGFAETENVIGIIAAPPTRFTTRIYLARRTTIGRLKAAQVKRIERQDTRRAHAMRARKAKRDLEI
jgi:hypothetical protein